jgi:hypothetical protein
MDPLARLEAERGGQFKVRRESGEVFELPSPLDLSWEVVANLCLEDATTFRHLVPGGDGVALWKLDLLREQWLAWHGLPSAMETRRLLYYLRRYSAAIEADLMKLPGVEPLTRLWQTRQWRRLLNAIDHLPRNSFFAEAVAGDVEHAEMVLRAQSNLREEKKPTMPISAYSDEVAALAAVVDRLGQVVSVIIAANSPKGSPRHEIEPYPRPETAAATIRHKIMREKHERLADQMLARRRKRAPQD